MFICDYKLFCINMFALLVCGIFWYNFLKRLSMPLDFISAHWTSWWCMLLLFFSWIEKLILEPLLCSSLDSKFLCCASSPYFFLFYVRNYFALLVTFLSDLISLYHFSRYMVLYFVTVPFFKTYDFSFFPWHLVSVS